MLPLLARLLAVILLFPGAAAATGTLQIFEASAGAGNVLLPGSPVAGLTLDVDFDAATAEGGGVFGFADLTIATTGDLTFDAAPNCQVENCTVNFTSTQFAFTSDSNAGQFGSVFDLFEVNVSGTTGLVQIVSGKYLDGFIGEQDVQPVVLASIPEPGTGLLVGLGLTLLALEKRRG